MISSNNFTVNKPIRKKNRVSLNLFKHTTERVGLAVARSTADPEFPGSNPGLS